MANLADAIAKSDFTAALQKKHEELEREVEREHAKLAVLVGGVMPWPTFEANLRTCLS